MNDREKAGLRGPVVGCVTEQKPLDPQSNRAIVTRESFHRDGRRTELVYSGPTVWSHRWIYDNDGRLKEEIADGAFAHLKTFVYDVKGRLEAVQVRDAGGQRLEESCTYYDDGTSLHTFYPRLPGGAGVMADSWLHMSVDAVRIMTLQDRRGNPLEKVLYNADDRPIQRVLFLYDSEGRLSEEGEADFEDRICQDFRNVFRYDALGRCVLREMHCSFGSERHITDYNDHGDVSETRRVPLPTATPSDIGLFSQASSTKQFRYEYDASGNWITCLAETQASDSGDITHREEKHRRVDYQ